MPCVDCAVHSFCQQQNTVVNAENSGSNHNYSADRVKKKSDFKLTVTVL